MNHRLFYFPDYRVANPYQTLLYTHTAPELHPAPATVAEALTARERQGPTEGMVFHLHWEEAAYRNEADEPAARAAAQAFVDGLELLVDSGAMLLWTLHNTQPHDGRYPEIHRAVAAALARLADLVHVHGTPGIEWARDRLGIEPRRLILVPHGNYLPLYRLPGTLQAASRAELGIPPEASTLLLFGRLDSYKGGAELLAALRDLAASELWLIVAGKQVTPLHEQLALLPDAVRGRIVVREGFVADEAIPPLFHAADALVAPYRRILGSGAAMLALSLARPVLAPAFAGIEELVRDGREALLWPPEAADGLATTLQRFQALDQERLQAMQRAALARAELHDWAISGNLLGGAITRLLQLRRPMRRLSR